ncbi:hypothetical protein HJFPF1_08044 [Paramyrothecium foliicola]|nr:hypothetical protein HJFPF1_08044 [Paramyrothecium foliicola]
MPRPAATSSELFAQASGQNQHRRATLAELSAHFSSGTDAERPAHWFEAQLIHYGLKPSKTKAVARMRLHDAIRAGALTVPVTVTRLESELKKEWTKNDRAVKKAVKAVNEDAPASSSSLKRKANDLPATAKASPAMKKAKSTTAPKSDTRIATSTTNTKTSQKGKTPAAPKATVKSSKGAAKPLKEEEKGQEKRPKARTRTTSTARRGGISQGPSRGGSSSAASTSAAQSTKHTRTKQTARRSKPFMGRGRIPGPSLQMHWDDVDVDVDVDEEQDSNSWGSVKSESDQGDVIQLPTQLAPLGLLNGFYDISSPDVSEQWSDLGSNFDLTLTLSGSRLWGKFETGIVEGVLLFAERPWDSSHDGLSFTWRGRERDGPISYSNDNYGSITFLGNGYIEGFISFMSITFRGHRAPGQGTASSITASSMQQEWDGYSEEQYEYENRARWGRGSGW